MVLLTKLRVIPYYFVIRVLWVRHWITGISFKVNFLAKKSMTVKLEKEMLEDVDNECEGLGCNRTDFIIQAVQEKLEGKTEESKVIQETKPEIKIEDVSELKNPTVEATNVRIIQEPIDNSKKPVIEMVEFNGTYIPKAEVYEI